MPKNPYIDNSDSTRAVLHPLLELDIPSWNGLAKITVETLYATLGRPKKVEDVELGWYPALQLTYIMDTPSGGLAVYIRNNEVVLIETLIPPPLSAMVGLGPPSAIKPHEILVENAYVHEYLYCERGLVLSIAESFEEGQPHQIVRCRGIRPIDSPEQFGPELYRAFEDKTVW
ncbi:MAG: hypothetical protein IMY85_10025 [Chloroflexi bacterium]|jgi:hypothetical protein|nr:hypothetical protein [Chloroflexota bacterium]